MILNEHGDAVPCFRVGRPYETGRFSLETVDLGEATFYATAASLYNGMAYEVRRFQPTSNADGESTTLFTVNASTIDWRKAKPEHVLKVKAFAHSLVANIDMCAPEERKDGVTA